MKFWINTSRYHYYKKDINEREQGEIRRLKELGMTFCEDGDGNEDDYIYIVGGHDTEINSLDELADFVRKYGRIIIDQKDNNWHIEIYNGYRE